MIVLVICTCVYYHSSGFNYEYLITANCEVFKSSQLIDSQEETYVMNRGVVHSSCDNATSTYLNEHIVYIRICFILNR